MVRLTDKVLAMMDKRRKLVGRLVRDESKYRGLTSKMAAAECHMAKVTMDRVRAGNSRVTMDTLIQVAGGFGWPLRFLVQIVDGDIERVRQSPVGTGHGEVRADILQIALDEMAQLPNPEDE
jgi:plasmid maintenance system antidote protein VapI